MRKLCFSPQNKNKNERKFSLAWNIVCWLPNGPCFDFFWDGKYGHFWAKKLMKIWYWLLKRSCFELFGNGKYGLVLRQKVSGKMIFTDYWNVLVLNFSGTKYMVFFEAKSWWKDYIYWLVKSSCFELFRAGKCCLFWDKKLMERWQLLIA